MLWPAHTASPLQFNSEAGSMTTEDLISDLIPVIYRLRALHRGRNGEKGSELEAIMHMLKNLDQVYSRSDFLSLSTTIDEILTNKPDVDASLSDDSSGVKAISSHLISVAENQTREVDPDIFSITALPSIQPTSKYVSLFDTYNFDDFEGYEGLDRTIEQLKADPNDLSAWDKMISSDPVDILEHPTFHAVQDLLSANLTRPTPNLEALARIYALSAKYITTYRSHFQGAQVCKLFLAHLLNLPGPLLSIELTICNLLLVLEFLSFYLPSQRGDGSFAEMIASLLTRSSHSKEENYLSLLLQSSAGATALRLYVQSQVPVLPDLGSEQKKTSNSANSLASLLVAVGKLVETERKSSSIPTPQCLRALTLYLLLLQGGVEPQDAGDPAGVVSAGLQHVGKWIASGQDGQASEELVFAQVDLFNQLYLFLLSPRLSTSSLTLLHETGEVVGVFLLDVLRGE
eukprot:gene40042-48785_t